MKREESLLQLHEGYREFVYRDSVGKLTIGYGFNLEDTGISELEAQAILRLRLYRLKGELWDSLDFFHELSEVRQAVLLDMRYNLGLAGLLGFKRMLKAVKEKKWGLAAREMLDSKWAKQVKSRARRLAEMMLSDRWPKEVL